MVESPDMTDPNALPVRYAQGRSTNFGKAKNQTHNWLYFSDRFRSPVKTKETQATYGKLTDLEQRDLKSIAGWWYRTQIDGPIRNRGSGLPSDLITLDFDYATAEFFEQVRKTLKQTGWACFLHTSRRHTPSKPRFRLVILLNTQVGNDTYAAASRIIAREIDPGMKHVDAVSFRPAQMMFMPTISTDGDFVFERFEGAPVDWHTHLDLFEAIEGDWRDVTKLPTVVGEKKLRETADKAEDPTEKDGPVGFFCRAYNVEDAIDQFDLPYSRVVAPSAKPRYTFTGGTTTNGAEVQDGGLFLYSHHGSDPCSDMLVNAFDLVRIHKFGKLDKDFDGEGKSPAKSPSWAAMIELAEKDKGYIASRMASKYDVTAMLSDLPDDVFAEVEDSETDQDIADLVGPVGGMAAKKNDNPIQMGPTGVPFLAKPRKRRAKPPMEWVNDLKVDQFGNLLSNVSNITYLFLHDLRFRDSLAFNEFENRPVIRSDIRSRLTWLPQLIVKKPLTGDPWQDHHDGYLRIILESPHGQGLPGWGLKVSDRDLKVAVITTARSNTFNPVRETLESFDVVPGARADSLWVEYLGCPDTPYYRETARLFMIACVARVYEPGCKFDFMPVIHGSQGCGKSTMVKVLAMNWFGELEAKFGQTQKLAEEMIGKWIMEVAELVSMTSAEVEPAKQFLSQTESQVRMAYDRNPTIFQRQTSFIGTTNDDDFLKDDTGNRRFWPIKTLKKQIDTDKLRQNLPGLWADAREGYKAMRAAHPHGDLPLFLTGAAATQAGELQDKALRPTPVLILGEQMKPLLDRLVVADDFEGVNDGHVPRATHLTEISPGAVTSWLNDMGIRVSFKDAVPRALKVMGWEKTGARARISGSANPVAVYRPGPVQIARWEDEDRPQIERWADEDAADDLI